jgi:hypothetical protein
MSNSARIARLEDSLDETRATDCLCLLRIRPRCD